MLKLESLYAIMIKRAGVSELADEADSKSV